MINVNYISAQSSFGLNAMPFSSGESFTSLNSFEFNPGNYSVIKDWGFSFTYGAELSDDVNSNLYQISISKQFGKHFISARYTPGFQKEFIFKSGEAITYNNTEPITLESKILYKELFGAGYSFKINNSISAGFNFRYFKQEFTEEIVTTIFSDTVYFIRETLLDNSDYWKSDFGINWKPSSNWNINLATVNLITFGEGSGKSDFNNYEIKKNKSFIAAITYTPISDLDFNFVYETNSDIAGSISYLFNLNKSKLGFAFSTFHDKQQSPFLAGANSSAIFISKYFDISLSYLKYFTNRNSTANYSDFKKNGISNIVNNKYSFDKILLTTNFKLNTLAEQRVKFLAVEINQNIYPAISDKYLDFPVATARVVNLTNEKIEVKPVILISKLNTDKFQSPLVTLQPYDTTDVKYFTTIPESYSSVNPELTYASFYLMSLTDEYDDEFQKPLLVNGINAWDGIVNNLRYFIKRDLDFSVRYSKEILSQHKNQLDTVINATSDFYKAKIIFNAFIKNLTYTSDPRASAEYVQYPKQTIELKGGDCDDLCVCYSSLLESIGIETAIIDYKSNNNLRHVNIIFNTKLSPRQAGLVTENDSKYFIRKNGSGEDEIWIPIETTSLSDFETAWSIGSDKFNTEAISNFGLVKGTVEIIDVY
ncbi:MAG: transglutaminase domain-containing protein [Ignavibacteriaceae bacterium]